MLAWFMLGYANHLGPLEELLPETDIVSRRVYGHTTKESQRLCAYFGRFIEKHETRCFLVNAGWHGGQIGQGSPLSKSEESG